MLADRLVDLVPIPDAALAQHALLPAGQVRTRPGPTKSAADSMRIIVPARDVRGWLDAPGHHRPWGPHRPSFCRRCGASRPAGPFPVTVVHIFTGLLEAV